MGKNVRIIMTGSNETYKIFSGFYDIYVGKFNKDLKFYKSYCDKYDKIIEIGCGTGRILEYFLESGYTIEGLDVSQEMLDKAKAKLSKWINTGKLKLFKHDFSSGKLDNKYDKALVSFYTFNYIIEKPAGFLRNVYESLNKNGSIPITFAAPAPRMRQQ